MIIKAIDHCHGTVLQIDGVPVEGYDLIFKHKVAHAVLDKVIGEGAVIDILHSMLHYVTPTDNKIIRCEKCRHTVSEIEWEVKC